MEFIYSGIIVCRGKNELESVSGLKVVECPSFRSVFVEAWQDAELLLSSRPNQSYSVGDPPSDTPSNGPKLQARSTPKVSALATS